MKHIIIIDDCVISMRILKTLLNNNKYIIHLFNRVDEFLKEFQNLVIDILIVDFMMFDIDGFDLINKIKPILSSDTKIFITSSYNTKEMIDHCKKLGISFLSKPYDKTILKLI